MQKNQIRNILAIETSCDDTSVAIVDQDYWVKEMVSLGQEKDHDIFGGIVPEIASRNHNQVLLPLVESCLKKAKMKWSDIDGICVTSEPGLLGSLIVGVITAKSLAYAFNKPILGINHLEGHLYAPFLKDKEYQPQFEITFPYVALAVSGGHTSLYLVRGLGEYEVLGRTRDDAAGEAFDKFAKMLGLGYPGGAVIDKLAKKGDVSAYSFPRTLLDKQSLDFSFSGVKSSAQRMISSMTEKEADEALYDLCASYQEAIVDTLLEKLSRAVKKCQVKDFIITGGVVANSRLREKVDAFAKKKDLRWLAPPLRYCTDNAAMIGIVGMKRMSRGEKSDYYLKPSSQSKVIS